MAPTSPRHEIRTAERLGEVRAYAPPAPSGRIDLKLDANEGPPPPPEFDALAADALADANRYPSPSEFEAFLAGRLDLSPEMVLVTAGVDDGLMRFAMAFLEPGRNAVLNDPTFEMIPRYVSLAGADPRRVPWAEGPYPVRSVLTAVDDQTGAVFMVTPNNPTGLSAEPHALVEITEKAPRAAVALDLAYAEFDPDADDLMRMGVGMPAVIAFRTLSKAWGLAGLRVGYAVGEADLLSAMRAAGNPYAVSRTSLAVARRWLVEGEAHVRHTVERVMLERELLIEELERLGARPMIGRANFVLADFGSVDEARAVWQGLGDRGIGVRLFEGGGPLAGRLRITCPADPAAFDRLTGALREIGKEAGR